MIGGSREYLTDRTFHVRTESGRMANAARKTAFTVFLALCIGLVVTLGILLGFFAKRSPLNCESGSSARVNLKAVCCKGRQSVFSPWSYSCENGQCVKKAGIPTQGGQLLSTCKLSCGKYGGIWPRPRNRTSLAKTTIPVLPWNIHLTKLTCLDVTCGEVSKLIKQAYALFFNMTEKVCISDRTMLDASACKEEILQNKVEVQIAISSQETKLGLNVSEAYKLKIESSKNKVTVHISGDTFFGARHGLETLSQLISYDMLTDSLQIVSQAEIIDSPAFPYRGLMLDTSRNFFSVKSILRVLDAMSYNKLNTFHWHITDTHSFPIVISKLLNMSYYGAYSEQQRYTESDVTTILNRAKVRGIHVLPEFDQPAHAGNGWQWGEAAGLGRMALCVNQEPWTKYCVEPPCGQLNPLNENTYNILSIIYEDYVRRFQPDLFHFGGDEVNVGCWNTSKEVTNWMNSMNKSRSKEDFLDLWNTFLVKATHKFKSVAKRNIPLIVWSSAMTGKDFLTKYLNNQTHIVQLWNVAKDMSIKNILENGFKVILSNYDHTYLDCGFGSWVSEGNNWCTPYKQWQLQYNLNPNKLVAFFNVSSERVNQVLGGETNMWSEQVDENSLEMKLWPRSAALAERMWSNPTDSWKLAEQRMMHHRQLLVDRGIRADALKPLWCYQNSGLCVV